MSTNASVMSNPAASVAALNRPVLPIDIAEKLGLSVGTVKMYLSHKYAYNGKGVELVRKTAEEMGYDPKASLSFAYSLRKGVSRQVHYDLSNAPEQIEGPITLKKIAEIVGVSAPTVCKAIKKQSGPIWELAMKYGYESSRDPAVKERKAKEKAERKAQKYYLNTPFHSVEERTRYMSYLRSQGYGNFDIARMAGTTPKTVRYYIGSESTELANHNRAMAQHIRAQKNAARKQYVLNKPIREHNAKVEEHNRLKAQVAKMEAELKQQIPAMEKLAAQKIDFPLIDLKTVQPTALQ